MSFESEFNVVCSTLSSNGALLLAINESRLELLMFIARHWTVLFVAGRGYLYNVKCRTLIGIHRFGHDVHAVKFSPDAK